MSSDKHNSIAVKAMGLIFSLFNVTSESAGHVPFCIPQYIHAFFMDLPVSSFADSERCQFGSSTWWLSYLCNRNRSYFIMATLTSKGLFEQFLICNAV